MKRVLILAGAPTPESAVVETVERLHERGYVVTVISRVGTDPWAGVPADEVRWLFADVDGLHPSFHRSLGVVPPGRVTSEQIAGDPWAASRLADADAIMVLDESFVFTAWQEVQRRPGVIAHIGMHATLRAIDERDAAARPVAEAAGEPAARRRRRPAWLRRPGRRHPDPLARGISDDERVERALAAMADLPAPAAAALEAKFLALLTAPKARADFLGTLLGREFVSGADPRHLAAAADAELAFADQQLADGRPALAVGTFLNAARMLFHRSLHMDSLMSPLAADPASYVAGLRSSEVWRRISAEQGRAQASVLPPTDRPAKVLFFTNGNQNFLGDLSDYLEVERGAEVRMMSPADLPNSARWRGDRGQRRRLVSDLVGNGEARRDAETDLREHFDWADLVFIDWATGASHYMLLADPGTTRVVLRLHSYEAFTMWPHLIDFSRVDRVVFVSDHLRDLTERMLPQLRDRDLSVTIPNAVDLRRFVLPKEPDARFTVGMVGYQVMAKDVRWAVRVVNQLRRTDARYRLKLVGSDFSNDGSAAFRNYRDAARAELAQLEAEGGLIRYGRTEDVAAALTDVGVILSSSVREGSPVAVLEGTASGAVPVVRNWPFFAGMEHGPRTIYPTEWVVETVEEAVDRILLTTSDAEKWASVSAQVSADAIRQWDLDSTHELYHQLIYGE